MLQHGQVFQGLDQVIGSAQAQGLDRVHSFELFSNPDAVAARVALLVGIKPSTEAQVEGA